MVVCSDSAGDGVGKNRKSSSEEVSGTINSLILLLISLILIAGLID